MTNFVLDQTTTVHFSVDQLMAIAVDVLQQEGHDFSEDTIKPTLNNKGLTLVIGKEVGKAAPKPRKKRAKKVEPETPVEPSEEATEEVAKTVAENNKNPFMPATPSSDVDADVAAIRESNGVAPMANFPSDDEVPTAAPAINFDSLTEDEG